MREKKKVEYITFGVKYETKWNFEVHIILPLQEVFPIRYLLNFGEDPLCLRQGALHLIYLETCVAKLGKENL